MECLFLFLRRLLIVSLVGVFISVSTFTGEAVADDLSDTPKPLNNTCTLKSSQPDFLNPPFAYANQNKDNPDRGQITLDAISGTFTLDGNTSGATYNGYLYGATYYDKDGKQKTLNPTYNPPTIVVSPGNSIDLTLTNDLPLNVELDGQLPQTEENLENQSQDTNLHYHGFNVSPQLGSDDVVMHVHSNVTPKSVKVPPNTMPSSPITLNGKGDDVINITSGSNSQSYDVIPGQYLGETTPDSKHGTSTNLPGGIYPGDSYPKNTYGATTEYHMQVNIPDKHQSGLFWYHPHVHTVSNTQVRAGMSGGIIVEDKRGSEKDSDTFQFLKGIKLTPDSTFNKNSEPRNLSDITQQVMMFKDFNDVLGKEETPPDCFTLNGQLNPKITIQPGEVQYWRIGNIGADNYMNLVLEKNVESPPQFAEPNKQKNFIILGRDGGSVKNPVATDSVLLPPASRVDLLVVGGKSGETYNFVSDFNTQLTTKQQHWVTNSKSYQLATVSVGGEEVCYKSPDGTQLTPDGSSCIAVNKSFQTLDDYFTFQMPTNVDSLLPDPVELASYPPCEKDKDDHTKCITPTDAYPTEPLTQERSFTFNRAALNGSGVFTINNKLYDENRIDKVSHLGDIEEWQAINATGAPHAFHMHQLDFLVTQVEVNLLKKDKSETCDCNITTYDNVNIVGEKFKDNGDGTCTYTYPLEPQGYRDMINLPPKSTTTIRIPFLNPFITGVFVYHCHILDHEDKGMMQNLKVIDPKSYKSTSSLSLVPNS